MMPLYLRVPVKTLAVAIALALVGGTHAQQTIYYVDPLRGDDSSSGTSLSESFQSLAQAVHASTPVKSGSASTDTVIYLREGIHHLNTPVVINLQAMAGSLSIAAYQDESPVLSGGKVIRPDWQRQTGSEIVTADIGPDLDVRQIYFDGQKGVRARTPNVGKYLQFETPMADNGFEVARGLLDGVKNFDQVEIAAKCKWMHKRLHIERVEPAEKMDRAVIRPAEWKAIREAPQGMREYEGEDYWGENDLAFLDSPGEWFYDRKKGTLYYWPPTEKTPEEVIIPQLETLLILKGNPGVTTPNITIRGIGFEHTGWAKPNTTGFIDVQANTLIPAAWETADDPEYRHRQKKDRIPAALEIESGSRIRVENCTFRHLGGTALMFNNGGCDNAIVDNRFEDIAASGIEIGNDAHRPYSIDLWPRRYLVFNNHIERIGTEYFGSIGIKAFYVDSITIQNNLIRDVPYSGIDVGWGWFTDEIVLEARNAQVRNNRIDTYLTELKDGAGIYSANPVFGSVIEKNYIRNMRSDWPDPAIYNDGSGAYWFIHANVIDQAQRWLGQQSWGGQRKRDILARGNFSTTDRRSTYGVNRVVENLTVMDDSKWPEAAQAIIQNAGLTDSPEPSLPAAESNITIIVDNASPHFHTDTAGWETDMKTMSVRTGFYGPNYAYTGESALVQDKFAEWQSEISETGDYHMYIRYPTSEYGAEYVPVEVRIDGKTVTGSNFIFTYDQRNPIYNNRWIFLGSIHIESGQDVCVRMLASGSGVTVADAVKFVKLQTGSEPLSPVSTDTLDLAASRLSVPKTAKLEDPGYFVWCASALRGPDGRYHLYYSRWPKTTGFQSWVTHSEIAYAVSNYPTGPFTPVNVALGARDETFWDAHVTHNPTVHAFDGRYYMYYMGNRGDQNVIDEMHDLNWTHRNNQRIGVAVADSPAGPWQRFDEPVLDISKNSSDPDSLCVSNPSVTRMPDGRFLMIYKAVGQELPLPFGGPVVHRIAIAGSPTGPFKKLDASIFTAPGSDFPAEDPFVWHDAERERYYAIVKDQSGHFTGADRGLALFTSRNGLDWTPAAKPLVTENEIQWEENLEKVYRLERPQVLFENGVPVALYVSVLDRENQGEAYNVHIPLESKILHPIDQP